MIKARQQLDTVLKYLYDKKDEARAIDYDIIRSDKDLLKITDNQSELERMILKLRDDKYIQMYPDYPRFADGKQDMRNGLLTYCSITFDGRLFYESGGYTQEEINVVKIENRKDRRENLLVWGTWAVAVGAIALVVWEMYKTFCLDK
jgi:hypothetical protein